MKLPKLRDLIPEQRVVYDHAADEDLFICGPPGSGKTTLAVYRARFVAEVGQTVVLVTRNRMLAALAFELGGEKVNASTMSTLISTDHSRRLHKFAPQPEGPYVYDWDAIDSSYTESKLPHAFDHVVIDEGQNLPPGFFRWARRFGGRTLTVFADEDQAIERLRSSLQDICEATELPNPYRLTRNHRNTQEIAEVAEHFHESEQIPPGVVVRGRGGERPRLVGVNSLGDVAAVVARRFENRREAIGVIVRRKDEVRALGDAIKAALPAARVDAYTSDSPPGVEHQISVLGAGVTVLTGEAVIGLEFDTVYLLDLDRSLPCETADQKRRLYMLCARARNALVLVDGPHRLTPQQLAALPPARILDR